MRVVREIAGPLSVDRVRYSLLQPDSVIMVHHDGFRGTRYWYEAIARVHLVLSTTGRAFTTIAGERHFWQNGEIWLGHYGYPHRVYNGDEGVRTHIVIDLRAGDDNITHAHLKRLFGERAGFERNETSLRLRSDALRQLHTYKCLQSAAGQHERYAREIAAVRAELQAEEKARRRPPLRTPASARRTVWRASTMNRYEG